ncbi:MAG: PadR family transcriptional regulator [Burkholderiaceae bacterium]
MSLPHALLTALTERPSSGSDLAARFDRSIDYFWHATHQQIYRELARMEAAGLIESLPEESTRGRKRAYRILAAGRRELKRWLAGAAAPTPLHDEMMVRLWAEAAVGPTRLKDSLVERRAAHEAQLALYRQFEQRDFTPPPTDRERALRHVVLQAGMRYEQYWIETLTGALAALDRPAAPAGA